jgi:hypothetical protein
MTKLNIRSVLIYCLLVGSVNSWSAPINVNSNDTIISVLTSQIGNRVTLRLNSGQELGGVITTVNDELTHIAELVGMEFYDAVVVNDDIAAVIVRTK